MEALKPFTTWLMQQVNNLNPERSFTELSLVLMDDAHMQDLNRESFERDHPTDVISFAYPPGPPHFNWTGEVCVNVERALQVGPEHDGAQRELALYIAHGIQHLSGADDATDAEREAMHRVECQWLEEATRTQALTDLFSEK